MRLTGLKAATNNSVVQSTILRNMFYHSLFTRFSLSVVSALLVCGIRRDCRMWGGGREREGGGARCWGGGGEREKEGQSRQEDRQWEAQRAGEIRRYKDRRRAAMDGKRERDERESES